MNFICTPCKSAGEDNTLLQGANLIIKRILHDKCKGGTWCDCQHRIGKKNV